MSPLLTFWMACGAPERVPDAARATLPQPPPGPAMPVLAGAPMVPALASGLVINEVISANQSQWQDPADLSTPDWIELFNAGDTAIALDDVKVRVGGNSWKGSTGAIEPGGYFFLVCDGLTEGPDRAPFGISKDGEEIELEVDGDVVDRIATGAMLDDVTWARFPDGQAWLPSIRATPGWSNGSAPPDSLDPRDGVFQRERLLRIDLFLTQDAINELNDSGIFTETWVSGDIVVDGIQYPNSAVRLKGSGSFQDMNGKPNFKLDLNTADSALRFRGLKGITLNSGNVYDPSRTHEYLAYRMAREIGLAAPRVGWAQAYVNGEYYGIYQNVESWDKEFYNRWWPTQDTGQLFEGSGCDFGTGYDPTQCKYDEGPEPPDLSGVMALDALVEGGANGPAKSELWTVLHHDKWLTYMAWEGITDHWDGYHSPNNWRFFEDGQTGLFEWLPSGTDWTWDGPPGIYTGNGNVIELCLDMPDCEADYEDFVLAVAQTTEEMDLPADLEDLHSWLLQTILDDPRSGHSNSDITSTFESTLDYLRNNPQDAIEDVL
jgi:hypothetical protein